MQSFGHKGIFKDEDVLREDWTPDNLPEREEELAEIHNAIAPASRGSTAHNLFLYGKTGQGKTVAAKSKTRELQQWADEEGDIDLTVVWFSCNNVTSSYSCAAKIVEQLSGKNPNGHDQQTVFDRLYEELDEIGGIILIVLDEIDNLGTSDNLLYSLPRARSNGKLVDARASVIGISNDFNYVSNLSPKVKDTLCEREIEFAPYNANQLRNILDRRVDKAFVDGAIDDGVVELCAAYAAKERGSARQAIRFLYESGELAHSYGDDRVTTEHVEEARDRLERERVEEGIRNVTPHDRLALTAVTFLECSGENPSRTKHVYEKYTRICGRVDMEPLGQRSLRDHLQELGMLGILSAARNTSGLQGGDYYTFEINTDLEMMLNVLDEDESLSETNIVDAMRRNARKNALL